MEKDEILVSVAGAGLSGAAATTGGLASVGSIGVVCYGIYSSIMDLMD